MTFQKGKELVGDRFTSIDVKLFNSCKSEVNELFPELCSLINEKEREKLSDDELESVCFLLYSLIDILISLRTNSRILLFNPKPVFDSGIRRLPATKLKDLNAFYDIFERETGYIASPTWNYDIAGLNQDEFFGSERFTEYCRSHDMLNIADPHTEDTLRVMSRSVVRLAERYDKFVESTAMNFAMVKAIEKLAALLTCGVSDSMKDFVEILSKLCKERERKLVLYSGQNLEEFCKKIVTKRLLGR